LPVWCAVQRRSSVTRTSYERIVDAASAVSKLLIAAEVQQ
jgi:hypothetical protein